MSPSTCPALRATAAPVVILLLLFFYLSLFGHLVSAQSSILAWPYFIASGHGDVVHSISDLLNARPDPHSTALINAKRIIQDLSTSPACTYGPTARLLKQCKSTKPRGKEHNSAEQLVNAQSTYGISMALCETRQARVPAPPACRIFENMLERQKNEYSIDVVRPDEVKDCLGQLFANQAAWTSFSNFKQQSFDLCDSSRLDYQREELLEHFREATNVIPEIIDALRDHQYEAQLAMQALRDHAASVADVQHEIRLRAQEQDRLAKERLAKLMQHVESLVAQVEKSGNDMQVTMADNADRTWKGLSLIKDKAGSLQLNLAEIYASAAEAVSGLTFDFEDKFDVLAQKTNSVIEQIIDLGADGSLQNIQESIALSRNAAAEFANVQTAQAEIAELQLATSQDVLRAIKDSHTKASEISRAIEMIPTSLFDALRHVHEHIAYLQTEITWSALFFIPSILLWLIGLPRASACTMLSYVLARAVWSVTAGFDVSIPDANIDFEELKLIGFCLLIAVCTSGAAALVASCFVWMFNRRNASTFQNRPLPQTGKHTSTVNFYEKNPNRFARASTVPV